jgi:hypothetical protein
MLAALVATSLACSKPKPVDPCDTIDYSKFPQAFVVVVEPAAGFQAKTPLKVRGCSRTFASQVGWELRAENGRVLVSGMTSGGPLSLAGAFSFYADFDVNGEQDAQLSVFIPEGMEGASAAAGRSVVPLVLVPNPLL